MSIEVLQTKVSALSPEQRRQLMAFMVALEDRSRPAYAEELARKIDDQTPGRWLTPEQCEQKLGCEDF